MIEELWCEPHNNTTTINTWTLNWICNVICVVFYQCLPYRAPPACSGSTPQADFSCYCPVSSGRSHIKKAKWISKMAAALFCPLPRKLKISWYSPEDAKESQTKRYVAFRGHSIYLCWSPFVYKWSISRQHLTTRAGQRLKPTFPKGILRLLFETAVSVRYWNLTLSVLVRFHSLSVDINQPRVVYLASLHPGCEV